MTSQKMIYPQNIAFSIELDCPEPHAPELTVEAQPLDDMPDTSLVRLKARSVDGQPLPDFKLVIRWDVPATDMHGMLYFPPGPEDMNRLPYWWGEMLSAANISLPFFALYHRNGNNRFAFGLLNQLPETKLAYTMSEQNAAYTFQVSRPVSPHGAAAWDDALFISRAGLPWPKIIQSYRDFVDREWPQPRLAAPPEAYEPVFCTWTAIHHDVNQDWIVKTAKIAADLGFKTWITDDGWFTEQAFFGNYAYAGDWQACEKKFPDFRGHVGQLHALGFRYLLWVAPFMVGVRSKAAQAHARLLQPPVERLEFANLSPWKAETGTIINPLLERLMRDYDLDGFKLDFIDAVRPEPVPEERDFAYAGEGVYTILSQAVDHLQHIQRDVLIELRNRYTNLAARRYGNLFRASDVPINFAMNRWQVTLERLLTPDRAILLDPALWHPQDSEENVAVTLINTIVSVPQVSVDLLRYPQPHLDLIRTWIGFYNAHRDTIIHGDFAPEFYRGFLPILRFTGANERIIGLYEDYPVQIGAGPLPLWILNASSHPFIDLLPDAFSGQRQVITRNKFGVVTGQARVSFPAQRLLVEVGGSVEIR